MNPSDLKKDHVSSVRINVEIYDMLRDVGLTPQKILDDRINSLFYVAIKNGQDKKVEAILREGGDDYNLYGLYMLK